MSKKPVPNTDENGVRYGVIAGNSIDSDVMMSLTVLGGTNVTYDNAYAEAKKAAEAKYDELAEEAEIAASEAGCATEGERERFIEKKLVELLKKECSGEPEDKDEFVDLMLEQFSDTYQHDEEVYEGEKDGVKYMVGWLGGGQILWVMSGTVGSCNSLCSPCVPNAGDLDSGFAQDYSLPYPCYVPPADWLRSE